MLAWLMYLEIELCGQHGDDEKPEICKYIGECFGLFAYSLGGWRELRNCISADSSKSLREMTFDQARRGFAVGTILKLAFENGGKISKACTDVYNNFSIEDKIIFTNTDYKIKKTYKYSDPEALRNKLWYSNRCVAHLWLAATKMFKDASDFADAMNHDYLPFNTLRCCSGISDGYNEFVQYSKMAYERATSSSAGEGPKRKPIIDVTKAFICW